VRVTTSPASPDNSSHTVGGSGTGDTVTEPLCREAAKALPAASLSALSVSCKALVPAAAALKVRVDRVNVSG